MSEQIRLVCVKEKSKLRVRIASPGYLNHCNCQFPRNIRAEGREYLVPPEAITLTRHRSGTYFYRVNKHCITVCEGVEAVEAVVEQLKVYGDDDECNECAVCYEHPKDVVFAPCGHYCCCKGCATGIKAATGRCPMCREAIEHVVDRDMVQ